MEKKPKDPDGLTGEDVLISVLIACAAGIALFIVILIVGATLSPKSLQRPVASSSPATSQSQPVRGTLPSQTQTPTPAAEPTQQPALEATPAATPEPTPSPNTNSSGKERRSSWPSGNYLGSVESDKYHDYECRAAQNILSENEVWFSSEAEAQSAGYSRCGICW